MNRTQSKRATCSEVSAVWKCMFEIWGIPSPYKSGAQNHLFRRFRNLTAILAAYIFGTKHNMNNRVSTLTNTWVSYFVSECQKLSSRNGFKLDLHFYPLSVNYAFFFITGLRRRTPANGIQPNFAKRWTVNRANNSVEQLGSSPRKEIGCQKLLHLFGFSTTSRLNGEYLLSETWHRQSGKGVGKYKGLPTSSANFVNFGPQTA